MQELAIDVEKRRPASFHMDYMRVPQLIVEALSHVYSPKVEIGGSALCHAEGCCAHIYLRKSTAAVR